MSPEPLQVRRISTEVIKPHPPPAQETCMDLAASDLAMLSAHHIEKGLLFPNPPPSHPPLISHLKSSLSAALAVFYPMAGRLATEFVPSNGGSSQMRVFVKCGEDTGAEFIHAEVDMSVADVTSPVYTPEIIQSFFPYSGAVNYDGHSLPLLTVQVTQLRDGVFIGCNFNHVLGDGTSFWEFFYAFGETSRGREISRRPILERDFLGLEQPLLLPFTHHDQFVKRFTPPTLLERVFHFTAKSMRELKKRTNAGIDEPVSTISSFQSLSALIWRAITRVRGFPPEQKTTCRLAANYRQRLQPPLPQEYFGNCIGVIPTTLTVSELMSHDLPWTARQVHNSVADHGDSTVREIVANWNENRFVYNLNFFDTSSVMLGSSPWFDMYGCEFGWGKAVATRSGYANKFDGKISGFPGRDEGSVDMEFCLPPQTMKLIEEDEEFMEFVKL